MTLSALARARAALVCGAGGVLMMLGTASISLWSTSPADGGRPTAAAMSMVRVPVPLTPDPDNAAEAERLELVERRASRNGTRRGPAVQAAPAPPSIVWPAAGGLTGSYAERRGGRRHSGIDIDGSTGDPVYAAAQGVVSWAGRAPAGYSGYGTVVVIDHGDGVQSISAHLSSIAVATGQRVAPGQRVGAIGTTGNVTGSHLHFELRVRGAVVNPLSWLPRR